MDERTKRIEAMNRAARGLERLVAGLTKAGAVQLHGLPPGLRVPRVQQNAASWLTLAGVLARGYREQTPGEEGDRMAMEQLLPAMRAILHACNLADVDQALVAALVLKYQLKRILDAAVASLRDINGPVN